MREHRRLALDVILIVGTLVCLATGMTLQVLVSTLSQDIPMPMRHATWLALGNGAVLLIAGVALLLRTAQPYLHRLEETEATNRAIVATALDGIVTVDRQGLIRAFNPAAARLFGLAESEALGQPLALVAPALTADQLFDRHWGEVHEELDGRRRDGTSVPLEVTGSRQSVRDQALWTGIFRDVTARRQAEEQLRHSYDLLQDAKNDAEAKATELAKAYADLDDFTYIVSHDLKEPLRGIHLVCQMLEEDYGPAIDDEGRRQFESLGRMCARAEQQIVDLLNYSRVGRQASPGEVSDCEQVLGDVLESLAHRITERRAQIVVETRLPKLAVGGALLSDILVNLIGNALKFNEHATPTVQVGCLGGDPARFYVRDNGIGIESRHHEAIFGIFRRLHGREKYAGTGAGLTIVRKIVTAYGGSIWLDSRPGGGTTFYFTLPLAPGESAETPAACVELAC